MFKLNEFLPYRLAILSQSISRLIATEYESRFGLTMNQWRVMVVLAAEPGLSAKGIGDRTLMEKMTISRVLRKLVARQLVEKSSSADDARASSLCLTSTGHQIHNEIIPLARQYEAHLIESLSPDEIQFLSGIISKLHYKAQNLST